MRRFYALVICLRNCVHLWNCLYLLSRFVPIVASDECLLLLRVAELEHVASKTARQISEHMYCVEPIKMFSAGGSDAPCCGAGSVEFHEVPGDERVKVFRCVGRRKSASAINFNPSYTSRPPGCRSLHPPPNRRNQHQQQFEPEIA